MPLQSRLELAWAAGFFDGEGSTVVSPSHRSLMVTISQVERANLFRFRAAVGGAGSISAPRALPKRQPISAWRVYAAGGQFVLQRLWPYLGEAKRGQALRALTRVLFSSCLGGRRDGTATRCKRGHEYSLVGVYR